MSFSLCLSPRPLCPPTLSPPPTGRVSLTRGASLLVERLTLEDEGWFECRILLLDSKKDDFQNGTWTFLSITGAALQGFGNSWAAPFVAHYWCCPWLEQPQHGTWLWLWKAQENWIFLRIIAAYQGSLCDISCTQCSQLVFFYAQSVVSCKHRKVFFKLPEQT